MALYDRKILKLTWQNSQTGTNKVKLQYTTDILHKMSDAWVELARKKLDAGDKNASGNLRNSLSVKIGVKDDQFIQLGFMALPYGMFVDQGVQGAGPFTPPKNPTGKSTKPYENRAPNSPFKFGSGSGRGKIRDGILSWLSYRRFQFRDDRGRFMSYDSMSYIISRSVYRYGIEPYPFVEDPYNKVIRKYQSQLAFYFGKDLAKYMDGKEYPTNWQFKLEM